MKTYQYVHVCDIVLEEEVDREWTSGLTIIANIVELFKWLVRRGRPKGRG